MPPFLDESDTTVNFSDKPRRGRPKKQSADSLDTREALLRAGMLILTESGFIRSGIDPILKSVGVPKGSFYHYFSSKEVFGLAVLDRYRRYFDAKLDAFLLDEAFSPLERLQRFVQDAQDGIVRHEFKRGCLVGNLEQESTLLSEAFRGQLQLTYQSWQARVAICLLASQKQGEINLQTSIEETAQAFWMGWEGAVHRARLVKSTQPLSLFMTFFIQAIQIKTD
ncbi:MULTISPECIES: TetR/AcrR family transcriptional regulator [Marinomonas]|uniref:TetR/AcrR family transcriptional regulator n=1 Tax=Marinomonas arctica TaxID=383750 RepID=A0A7H1J6F6_9GAMM|nr:MULTISPECIES: TetR/AcrR family transcriptional regulator [Marinomonas]MCS7485059.1 TetR family transcriptional regulator [Marinomonas sp. BSi20414]QNT06072.1 TetR/AcrR family transcriptional regulator [Marinomonas arctica]GGN19147.1 TetR family transcriptional regulator [Marinomonas arctica]